MSFQDPLVDILPGHGGFDPGAVNKNTGAEEAQGNYNVALMLAYLLDFNEIGWSISREEDQACGGAKNETQDVTNQINFANKSKADIAVAIHFNSSINKTAHGVEVLYTNYPIANRSEIELAKELLSELVEATGLTSRGIKETPKGVGLIKKVSKPCVLSENAFVSNDSESIWCTDEDHQWIIAVAHAKAICKYFGRQFKNPLEEGGASVSWKDDIMNKAVNEGLIGANMHKPNQIATKWFVLAVALNLLEIVKKLSSK